MLSQSQIRLIVHYDLQRTHLVLSTSREVLIAGCSVCEILTLKEKVHLILTSNRLLSNVFDFASASFQVVFRQGSAICF